MGLGLDDGGLGLKKVILSQSVETVDKGGGVDRRTVSRRTADRRVILVWLKMFPANWRESQTERHGAQIIQQKLCGEGKQMTKEP